MTSSFPFLCAVSSKRLFLKASAVFILAWSTIAAHAQNPTVTPPPAISSSPPPAASAPPAPAAPSTSAARGSGLLRGRYGEWEMRCDTPAGAAREQCALLQSVEAEGEQAFTLDVIVLKMSDGKGRLLRVIAPLGVLLPNGLGLKVDDADIGRAGFVRCIPRGCVAEVVLEDKLIEQLRAGTTATFIIYRTPEAGAGLPLTLKGFQQGFDALP